MPDSCNLTPGRTLRLALLQPPLLNYLRVARPAAKGCAACGRPWRAHRARRADPAPCERCGTTFEFGCYLRHVAGAEELARFEDPDDDMTGSIFLCRGCRS